MLVPTDTNKNKVSLTHDSVVSKLNLTVYYSNFSIQNSSTFMELLVGLPQGELIGAPNSVSQETSTESEAVVDIVDYTLMIGYCKYTVHSVTNGSARVVAEDGSRSSLQVPEDHANELIDELNL